MSTDPVQDPTRDGNDPEELRSRFNAVVLETIETLLPGLAALYVLYSALSLAMLSTDAGAAMALALTAAVSAAGHIFLRSALRRG